jgi:hypothetical protein
LRENLVSSDFSEVVISELILRNQKAKGEGARCSWQGRLQDKGMERRQWL